MIFSQKPGGAAYIDRTERPPIESVQVATQSTPFNQLKAEWNALTAEEQEERLKAHDWTPGAAAEN